MELNQLRCFLAVAQEKSFTRGAKVCNMTQPSLSYQIGKLEEELGETLFHRRPRLVELSEAGKLLLEGASSIMEEQERIVSKFRLREELQEGEIRFGIIPTMAPYMLPPLLGSFRREYPGIRLITRESRTSQLLKEVVSEELEFAIVSDVEKASLKRYSLHLTPLMKEELQVAAPSSHRLCGVESVSIGEMAEQELILLSEGNCLRDQIINLCKPKNAASALVCEQLPTQLAMVGAGLGMAIVPEMSIRGDSIPGVSYLKFGETPPKRMIGLLKKRGKRLSLAAQEFVKRLNEGVGS